MSRERRLPGLVLAVVMLSAGCTAAPSGSAATVASPGLTPSAAAGQSAAGGPSAVASPTPSPTIAASVTQLTAEADGLTLTVMIDHSTLAPGGRATILATLRNDRSEPVIHPMTICGGAAMMQLRVPLPGGPVGKTWDGIAGRFKDYVLTEGMGPGIVPALEPLFVQPRDLPCLGDQPPRDFENAFEGALGAGESVIDPWTWTAEIASGVPAVPGPVAFTVSAAYDRQNEAPSQPPDGPGVSWFPIYKQLKVTGEFTIEGDAPTLASPGEVVDGLLADKTFTRWLKQQPARTWSNANLFLTSSPTGEGIVPKGPSWEIDLFREQGVPRHWAIAFVDPFDASLLSTTYCDIPCDR